MPKGTVHVHSSMRLTAELYAKGVLGLKESDVVFSAAKFFFAYGLGNSLSFPLVGRRDHGADGRAADAGRGVQAADGEEADDVLRRADAVRGNAGVAGISRPDVLES